MSRVTPFGVARQAFAPATPLEAWLERVAAATTRSFDLGPEHAWLAWESTGWEPALEESARKALFLVVLASLVTQGRGSTRMPLLGDAGRAYVRSVLEGVLVGDDAPTIDAQVEEIEKLAPTLGAPGDRRPFLVEGDFFYHQKLHRSERLFAESLVERLTQKPAPAFAEKDAAEALGAVLAKPALAPAGPVQLSPEQQLAVLTALFQPLTVVSGGPGTGKTSIVVSILRVLVRLGVPPEEIALAAPTGKAAQRMGESIARLLGSVKELEEGDRPLLEHGPQPQTIHKLLGASADGSRMKHHEGNRLEQRVLIVDEASMIDMSLMEKLVRAAGAGARLVLLGDARQLPSVGAGAVLRDLIPEGSAADTPWRTLVRGVLPAVGPGDHPLARNAVRLTRNYRMNPKDPAGLAILELAKWISPDGTGARPPLEDVLVVRESVAKVEFERAEAVFDSGPKALRAFLERWYAERIASLPGFDGLLDKTYRAEKGIFGDEATAALSELFAHFESTRVLCLTRVYRTGAVAVNAALRAFHFAHRKSSTKHEFTAGEPVLMLSNDYDKGIWNGDQGIALWVSEDGAKPRLSALFRRGGAGFVGFPVELLRGQLEHCFAMTVHKCQGSEFERVVVVLPELDGPLLTREILYTAVTRTRRSVLVLGAREMLEAGAQRTLLRFSGVGERLAAKNAPPSR
ncbi:exodeoxyribonuclease V subunit alpha [bacterium]|nr:exodeoxyribonuclease V subunit alpha [bacterium]